MSGNLSFTEISNCDELRWQSLFDRSINATYRLSLAYRYANNEVDQEVSTFIFSRSGRDIAGAHFSLKKHFKGIVKVSDLMSGILLAEPPGESLLSYITEIFIQWSGKNKAAYARINAWLPAFKGGLEVPYFSQLHDLFLSRDFTVIEEGRSTYWINLLQDEADLLKTMKHKTRYNLKQGEKSGFKILKLDIYSEKEVQQFWDLYNELGGTKKFSTLSERKFKNIIKVLMDAGLASLFLVIYNDVIINYSLASNTRIAAFMYGAVNPVYRNLEGCSSPGYIAHWEMIKAMKSLGKEYYDLGFSPGEVPYPEHPSFDIWRFKYGFGGQYIQFMPTYGRIIKPIKGLAYRLIRYKR